MQASREHYVQPSFLPSCEPQVRAWAAGTEIKDAALGPRLLDARKAVEREMVRRKEAAAGKGGGLPRRAPSSLAEIPTRCLAASPPCPPPAAGALQAAGEGAEDQAVLQRGPAA